MLARTQAFWVQECERKNKRLAISATGSLEQMAVCISFN